MSAEQGFLQAVLEAPDDDVPRLIFADWLEDHGGAAQRARAEFIRAQIERDRLPPDHPRRTALDTRADELLAEHLSEWLGSLGEQTSGWVFRRGFVESAIVELEPFDTHAEALFCAWPVRHLRIQGKGAAYLGDTEVRELARSPHLARLNGLTIRHDADTLTAAGVAALASCPFLAGLRELDLKANDVGTGFGPEGARALAGSPHLAQLMTLRLGGHKVSDAGARALATSPFLRQLRVLDLSWNGIKEEGMRALAFSPNAANLTALYLGSADLDTQGTRALVESPHLHHLTTLSLAHAHVAFQVLEGSELIGNLQGLELSPCARNDLLSCRRLLRRVTGLYPSLPRSTSDLAGLLEGMAQTPELERLEILNLFDQWVETGELLPVLQSPHLPRLRRLDLWFNRLGDEGLEELARLPLLSRLTDLNVRFGQITADGVKALASSRDAAGLRILRLTGNDIGDAGLRALARSPHLTGLRELELCGVGYTDAGVKALAGASFPHLRILDLLSNDSLGDGAARALAKASWPLLSRLVVSRDTFSEGGFRRLQERWGPRLEWATQDAWE